TALRLGDAAAAAARRSGRGRSERGVLRWRADAAAAEGGEAVAEAHRSALRIVLDDTSLNSHSPKAGASAQAPPPLFLSRRISGRTGGASLWRSRSGQVLPRRARSSCSRRRLRRLALYQASATSPTSGT